MWSLIKAVLEGFFRALFGWGQEQAEKPPKIEDAKTPEKIKGAWTDYIERERAKLRDEDNHRN